MGGLEGSDNVTDMTLGRRVLIGANALQEANRENEPIPDSIIELLEKQLEIYRTKNLVRSIDMKEFAHVPTTSSEADIIFEKVPNQSEYQIFNHGTIVGKIYRKNATKWLVESDGFFNAYKTLKAAKTAVVKEWE
ncbi:unnamed protein product [marine sediment metagenome]|uniref:Uncharacterized protein n=1 Tax=marine sediment metagenome TaxID=412755 RepID=X1PYR3_9ZZZZ